MASPTAPERTDVTDRIGTDGTDEGGTDDGAGRVQGRSADTSAGTRHLSAGAYLDPEFRAAALSEIYCRPKRMVAPSYGFDAVTVFGHCLIAQRAMLVRDLLMLGLVVAASWLSLVAAVALLAILLAMQVATVAARVVRSSITYLLSGRVPATAGDRDSGWAPSAPRSWRMRQDRPQPRRHFVRLWLENVVLQVFAVCIGPVLVYGAFLMVTVAVALLVWRNGPADPPRFALSLAEAVECSLAGVLLVAAAAGAWSRFQVRMLVPGTDPAPPLTRRRLDQIASQNQGNTVVYSGYHPFVGSGDLLRRWNFTQRLVRRAPHLPGVEIPSEAEREFETPPFSAADISGYVRDRIGELARDPVPERGIADLTVADLVFVAGTEIGNLQPHTSADDMEEIIRNPTAPERHYVQCQVVSWHGELVTTVYVHFAVQGRSLYMELQVYGLFPCNERYRVIDQVGGTGLKRVVGAAGRAALSAPLTLASAPSGVVRVCTGSLRLLLDRRSAGRRLRRGYDYGALVGVRELGASADTRDHMQRQDIDKYGRVVERRVVAAVLDFLEDNEVDVTEYRQQSLTVLNAGAVATTGGTVTVQGDAVGSQVPQDGGGTAT